MASVSWKCSHTSGYTLLTVMKTALLRTRLVSSDQIGNGRGAWEAKCQNEKNLIFKPKNEYKVRILIDHPPFFSLNSYKDLNYTHSKMKHAWYRGFKGCAPSTAVRMILQPDLTKKRKVLLTKEDQRKKFRPHVKTRQVLLPSSWKLFLEWSNVINSPKTGR